MNGRLVRATIIFLLLAVYLPLNVSSAESLTVTATTQAGGDILLEWDPGVAATTETYDIYYDTVNSQPGSPQLTGETGHSVTIAFDASFSGDTIYFWVDGDVDSVTYFGAANAVSDSEGPVVTLGTPDDDSLFVGNSIEFTWSGTDISSVAGYQLIWEKEGGSVSTYPLSGTTTDVSKTNTLSDGTYTWKVKGVDGLGHESFSEERSFVVNTDQPQLLLPEDGAVISTAVSGDITFSWEASEPGFQYHLIVTDSSTTVDGYLGTNTSYTSSYAYVHGEQYHWEVCLQDTQTDENCSFERDFIIDNEAPDVPTNLVPTGGTTLNDSTPLFSWDAVSGAESYSLEVSNDGFSTTVYTSSNITGSTHQMAGYTLSDGSYSWHVRAADEAGNVSDWSTAATFSVDMPPAPVLVSPADGSTTTDTTPTLNWNAVSEATSYSVEYSTDGSFATSTEVTVTGATTYTFPSALADDTYYWRVSATLSGGGETDFSGAWDFTVEEEPPVEDVSFSVVVLSGSTGDTISSATVRLSQGTVTLGTSQTDTLGRTSFSVEPGSYTLQVTKNLWDNGAGSDYTQSLSVSSSTNTVTVLLYEEGRDLIVATVRYNDAAGSTPDSVIVYRNGSTYMTVTLPSIPPGILPSNLINARTNLVLSVPDTGSYTIADPNDPDGAVPVSSLSSSLTTAYNNAITLSVTSSVTGLVVDEQGNIITGASVWLLRPESDGTMSIIGVPVESSTIGFIFNYILPDTYKIRVRMTGYDEYNSDEFAVGTNETENVGMVVLTQQKGTLNITVQDAAGDLLTGAQVIVENSAGTMVFNQLAPQGIVGTELIPGSYTVTATLDGYEVSQEGTAIVSIDTPASATVVMDEAEPPPPETGSFELTLSDADGNPLQLAEVFIGETKVGVTNQEGILLLEDLEPGTYTFTFVKEGYAEASATIDVVAGETATSSAAMETETPVDEGSGSNTMLYILAAVVFIVIFAAVILFMKKRSEEEGSIISDGSRPSSGPRSMPPPETLSAVEEQPKARPRVTPRATRGLPPGADSTSGLPTSSNRREGRYSGSRSKSGIPTDSIKDDE